MRAVFSDRAAAITRPGTELLVRSDPSSAYLFDGLFADTQRVTRRRDSRFDALCRWPVDRIRGGPGNGTGFTAVVSQTGHHGEAVVCRTNKAGNLSIYSVAFLRYWFLNYLMNNTRRLVLPLYATLFLPRFLRSLGASIGRNVEISTISQAMPDLLDIGEGSFLADGCIVGGANIARRPQVELKSNRVGRCTFVGNSALVPAGINLGDDGLVGVLSTPPTDVTETQDTTRWLGSPGFLLPATEKVSCFSARSTYEPGVLLRTLARILVDVVRLPSAKPRQHYGSWAMLCFRFDFLPDALTDSDAAADAAFWLGDQSLTLIAVAALRHLFIGQFKPTVKPLWTAYVWFNES